MKTKLKKIQEQMEKDMVNKFNKTIFPINVDSLTYIDSICIVDIPCHFIKKDVVKVYFISIPYDYCNSGALLKYRKDYMGIKCNNKIYKIEKFGIYPDGSIELNLKLVKES